MIKMRMKVLFFDAPKVIAAVDKARIRVLSKLGAFLMTRARTRMRPGGKKGAISQPGEPPRTHVGLLKSLLFFGYDPATKSVVVGPNIARAGTVPLLLEKGGTTQITEYGKSRVVTIAPRPYMAPALAETLPKMPREFADSVRIA